MSPESIHEEFNEEAEPAVAPQDDEPVVLAEPDESSTESISEGPAADATEKQPTHAEDEQADASPEPDGKPVESAGTEKTVPYGALHQEREIRKEVQAQLAQTQQALGQMMALKEQLNELRRGAQTSESKAEQAKIEQKFEEDPIGALREQQEALQSKLDKTEQETKEQQERRTQADQRFEQFRTVVTQQVADFEKDHEDYPQAYQYLMDKRLDEYRAMGITDPVQLQQSFDREALSLANTALQRGKNPAEVAYEMAKVRGYSKEEPKKEDKGESLEQTMDRLEKGTQAASTNQGGNGGTTDDTPSLGDISKMSDSEFDKYWAEMEKQANGGSLM